MAYTIVVGVANPDTVSRLMYTAAMMARQFSGRVVAASVVPPASGARSSDNDRADAMSQAEELLQEALARAQRWEVQCDSTILVARQIHEGLVDVALAHQANVILVGFPGRQEPPLQANDDFDRIIDALAARAPCHLLVAKYRDGKRCDRVLVPVVSEINLDLTKDIVTALHCQAGAAVDFVHFTASAEEAERGLEQLQCWLEPAGLADWGRMTVQTDPQPAVAIVAASQGYDALVVGTAPLHALRRRLFGSIAEHIANHAACTAYLVRARERP